MNEPTSHGLYDETREQQQRGSSSAVSIHPPPPVSRFEDTYACGEIFSLIFSWLITLTLWFHLLIVIPYCEPFKRDTYEPLCLRYYYDVKYHWYFWIVFCSCYILYLCQAFASPTRRYLKNVLSDLGQYTNQIVHARPNFWWKIQCFHYTYHTVHYTDSKGNRRTRTERTRHNTHAATGAFDFDRCEDTSDTTFVHFAASVTRVRLEEDVKLADARTRQRYDAAFEAWVAANDRDTHKEVSSGMNVPGFESYVLSYKSKEETMPLQQHVVLGVHSVGAKLTVPPLFLLADIVC